MISVAAAEAAIAEQIQPFGALRLGLDAVCGHVLREEIAAERDQPPFDRVTMDGIAIAYRDWRAGLRRFRRIGVQAAGSPPLSVGAAGDCIEVMTGTMLPEGTDTVIPVENITTDGEARNVGASTTVAARQYVHPKGSDRAVGAMLLAPGCRIGAAEIAVLASAGYATVAVTRTPRVAVISTGDELVEVDEPLKPYQIRSTNDRAIEASLTRQGLAQVTRARLKDDREALLTAIRKLHDSHDVLILSGGVSRGQFDFVPGVLEDVGARQIFHRVAQRPGKPLWFGVTGQRKPVFALPGNPVSTLACLTRYVLPALRQATLATPSEPEYVQLSADAARSPQLTYFLPVKLRSMQDATVAAEPKPTNTSGDFVSLIGTAGFVELPPGDGRAARGEIVKLFRW